MFNGLKNHPFAVEAYFDRSLVLTFAVPLSEIVSLIPPKLRLDTFQDQWAFVAAAMVQTKALRPKGFPAILGNNFFLIGYRIFVRYQNLAGKNLRGLYILKSATNKKKMELLGGIFTHYNYQTTDIAISQEDHIETITSKKSDLKVVIDTTQKEVTLPAESPFNSWKEARRFAGPLPFTFTCNTEQKTVLIIEGVRQHWRPEPVTIADHHIGFLSEIDLKAPVLASAFQVRNIPYYWKKGKQEQWQ
ncbi:MAG: DUF2071 domain-containing protein [Bacteroidota bacterium]